MKKRILSLLLAAVIVLSLLPLSATALVMSPADKLSFSIDGKTVQIFESEADADSVDYIWHPTCTVTISDAVRELGSPDRLWYYYGDEGITLTNENGDTLTAEGNWANPKTNGASSMTVEMPFYISKTAVNAAPAGIYTGTFTFVALIWDETQRTYFLQEYTTATLMLELYGGSVTVVNPTGCTITVDQTTGVRQDANVYVRYTLDEGYYLQKITCTDVYGNQISVQSLPSGEKEFVMPNSSVTVSAEVIPPHTLTLVKPVLYSGVEGIELHADATSPVKYGAYVFLSATFDPDVLEHAEYYSVESWEVKNPTTGQYVTVEGPQNDGKFFFKMPNFDVRAIPTIKYEDPNQGTGTIVDPDPGIAPVTDSCVVLYRNDGTNTMPPYITLWTSGDGVYLPHTPFEHPDGYAFLGWSQSPYSHGARFRDGEYVGFVHLTGTGPNYSLYAIWAVPTSFNLTVDPAGEIPYGATNATVTLHVSDLDLGYYGGQGTTKIQFYNEGASFHFFSRKFDSNGSQQFTVQIDDDYWHALSPGEQNVVIPYRAVDASDDNSVDQYVISKGTFIAGTTTVPDKYAVTLLSGDTGSIATSMNFSAFAENEEVLLIVKPANGYALDEGSLTVTYTDGENQTQTITPFGEGKYYYFTMPPYPVNVTASFSPVVSGGNTYSMTVINGSGSGDYAAGESVTVIADAPDNGTQFKMWLGADGLTFTEGDATTETATFTMPAEAVTLTAVYKLGVKKYVIREERADNTVWYYYMEGEPSDSIDVVKEKIRKKTGYPVGQQELYWYGTLLEDGHTLADYGIKKGDFIDLVRIDLPPIRITQQPGSWQGEPGDYPEISVIAEGEGLTYQWFWRNAGKTAWNASSDKDDCYDSYPLTVARNGREVYCRITDENGNFVDTEIATMSFALPEGYEGPVITAQPTDWRGVMGEYPDVSLTAEGEGTLTYKWYYRSPGKTKFTLSSDKDNCYDSYPLTLARAGRELYCVVTDKYGLTAESNHVTMDFDVPEGYTGPTVLSQPQSWYGDMGEYPEITFAVEGEGLTYQWYYRKAGATKWYASSDKDNCYDSYPLTAARNGREVYCVVTDRYGFTVASEIATMNEDVPMGLPD